MRRISRQLRTALELQATPESNFLAAVWPHFSGRSAWGANCDGPQAYVILCVYSRQSASSSSSPMSPTSFYDSASPPLGTGFGASTLPLRADAAASIEDLRIELNYEREVHPNKNNITKYFTNFHTNFI